VSNQPENTDGNGRDPNGRFTLANAGRPKGAKNKLQEAFWKDFAEAWETHGVTALETMAIEDPATFVKVAASTITKDVSLDMETRYVIRAPLPCATAEEWQAEYCQPARELHRPDHE
jgi:hypothetical protein